VPCGFTKSGLPAGLQIVGRMFEDQTVLRASYAYEQATKWHQKRPALGYSIGNRGTCLIHYLVIPAKAGTQVRPSTDLS